MMPQFSLDDDMPPQNVLEFHNHENLRDSRYWSDALSKVECENGVGEDESTDEQQHTSGTTAPAAATTGAQLAAAAKAAMSLNVILNSGRGNEEERHEIPIINENENARGDRSRAAVRSSQRRSGGGLREQSAAERRAAVRPVTTQFGDTDSRHHHHHQGGSIVNIQGGKWGVVVPTQQRKTSSAADNSSTAIVGEALRSDAFSVTDDSKSLLSSVYTAKSMMITTPQLHKMRSIGSEDQAGGPSPNADTAKDQQKLHVVPLNAYGDALLLATDRSATDKNVATVLAGCDAQKVRRYHTYGDKGIRSTGGRSKNNISSSLLVGSRNIPQTVEDIEMTLQHLQQETANTMSIQRMRRTKTTTSSKRDSSNKSGDNSINITAPRTGDLQASTAATVGMRNTVLSHISNATPRTVQRFTAGSHHTSSVDREKKPMTENVDTINRVKGVLESSVTSASMAAGTSTKIVQQRARDSLRGRTDAAARKNRSRSVDVHSSRSSVVQRNVAIPKLQIKWVAPDTSTSLASPQRRLSEGGEERALREFVNEKHNQVQRYGTGTQLSHTGSNHEIVKAVSRNLLRDAARKSASKRATPGTSKQQVMEDHPMTRMLTGDGAAVSADQVYGGHTGEVAMRKDDRTAHQTARHIRSQRAEALLNTGRKHEHSNNTTDMTHSSSTVLDSQRGATTGTQKDNWSGFYRVVQNNQGKRATKIDAPILTSPTTVLESSEKSQNDRRISASQSSIMSDNRSRDPQQNIRQQQPRVGPSWAQPTTSAAPSVRNPILLKSSTMWSGNTNNTNGAVAQRMSGGGGSKSRYVVLKHTKSIEDESDLQGLGVAQTPQQHKSSSNALNGTATNFSVLQSTSSPGSQQQSSSKATALTRTSVSRTVASSNGAVDPRESSWTYRPAVTRWGTVSDAVVNGSPVFLSGECSTVSRSALLTGSSLLGQKYSHQQSVHLHQRPEHLHQRPEHLHQRPEHLHQRPE
eukprot:Lankesteria_metandrocarpae@DN586_c0_g1_i1.p1